MYVCMYIVHVLGVRKYLGFIGVFIYVCIFWVYVSMFLGVCKYVLGVYKYVCWMCVFVSVYVCRAFLCLMFA